MTYKSHKTRTVGEYSSDSKEFHLKEFECIRKEIEILITERFSLERNVVVAVGVSWGWLFHERTNVPSWAWLIPCMFAALGFAWSFPLLSRCLCILDDGQRRILQAWRSGGLGALDKGTAVDATQHDCLLEYFDHSYRRCGSL
jgi:hypothetical protein